MKRRGFTLGSLATGCSIWSWTNLLANDHSAEWQKKLVEAPPDHQMTEPVVSLSEALRHENLKAQWQIIQKHKVRLCLQNTAQEMFHVHFEPGTVLTGKEGAWLLGGPSRYLGQFGGFYQANEQDHRLYPVSVSLVKGQRLEIIMPVIELTQSASSKVNHPLPVQPESARKWTKDNRIAHCLAVLSSLGTSLSVAQGIAWRLLDKDVGWERYAGIDVEGQMLNGFEKRLADRFLELHDELGQDWSIQKVHDTLLNKKLTVVVTGSGVKAELLEEFLKKVFNAKEFMGARVNQVQSGHDLSAYPFPLKLEAHLSDVIRKDQFVVDWSLASNAVEPSRWNRFARVRSRLLLKDPNTIPEDFGKELLENLETQMAPQLMNLIRVGQGAMTDRFRLENNAPTTISQVNLATGLHDSEDPPVWTINNLGLSPRGRTFVRIPSHTAKVVGLKISAI